MSLHTRVKSIKRLLRFAARLSAKYRLIDWHIARQGAHKPQPGLSGIKVAGLEHAYRDLFSQ
jgi:hypothetical protein